MGHEPRHHPPPLTTTGAGHVPDPGLPNAGGATMLPALMSYIGADGRYQFVNHGYKLWFNLSARSVVGRHMRDVLGEQAWDEIRPFVQRALAGETITFETTVAYRRSGPRRVRATYTPDIGDDGVVHGFGVLVVGLADPEHGAGPSAEASERALRQSRKKYLASVESSPGAVLMVDDRGRIATVNAEFERLAGYGRDELIGEPVEILVPEALRELHGKFREAYLREPVARRMGEGRELTLRRRDGDLVPVEIALSPQFDLGSGTCVMALVNDISDRKRAEEALRESEATFRAIAETTPDIIFTSLPDGTDSYINPRFYEYTGLPLDTPMALGWVQAVHPDDQQRARERWLGSMSTGEPYEIEYRLRTADGRYRWFAVRARPLRDDAGRIVQWVGCCSDIHDAIAAQEVLAGVSERLQSAVEAKTVELERTHQALRLSERMAALGTFAAGMGHDLANLLLPVRTRLEELAALPALPEAARHGLDAIQGSMKQVQLLCRGLRLFAMDPDADLSGATRLAGWCDEIKPVLRTAVPQTIGLRCIIPEELPDVAVAPHRLSQVVLNLVQNARDAILSTPGIPAGGTHEIGDIELGAEPICKAGAAAAVRLWVRDTGPGMPEQVRARCLEPFFTTKARTLGGTGLGLSIVHTIVTKSGGRIEIQSSPGSGTTFSIFLPAFPAAVRADADPHALITLRDPRTAAFAASILSAYGFTVRTSSVPAAPDKAPPASLWITDATPEALHLAQSLPHEQRPPTILVLGGDELWRSLGARVLPAGTTFAGLRAAVDTLLQESGVASP